MSCSSQSPSGKLPLSKKPYFQSDSCQQFPGGLQPGSCECSFADQSHQSGGSGHYTTWWAPGLSPPRVQFSPLQTVPGLAPPTFSYAWNAYQVYDDAFLTRGLHSLKFGFGYERDQLNEPQTPATSWDFQIWVAHSVSHEQTQECCRRCARFSHSPLLRISIVGAYVQDDWRFRPNLTLNLGLRWEMSTVPMERRESSPACLV